MQSPPEPGEVWVNIHTGAKATIIRIEDVPSADGGKVIIYSVTSKDVPLVLAKVVKEKDKDDCRCNVPFFVSNWKRHKSASKWHLGTNFDLLSKDNTDAIDLRNDPQPGSGKDAGLDEAKAE